MNQQDLIHHPAIIKMAQNLWRPVKVQIEPAHRPPVIINGAIVGETNPPVFPETPEELQAGMKANLLRNITHAKPAGRQSPNGDRNESPEPDGQWTWPEKLLPAFTPEGI